MMHEKIGYYEIPSKIMLGNQPVVSTPAPTPAPAPALLKVAPPAPAMADTTQSLNRAEEAKSAETVSTSMPLDQPTPVTTNRPAPVAAPPVKQAAPPLPAPVAPAAPASKPVDTTQALNHLEDTKTASTIEAVPLDAPTPLTAKPAPAIQRPVNAAPIMKSGEDLAVAFAAGSTSLTPDANARLDSLTSRLKQNADLRVELRSMASTGKDSASKARRTSLSRALEIKSYLARQGISEDRIDVRALGAPSGETASDRVDFFLMR